MATSASQRLSELATPDLWEDGAQTIRLSSATSPLHRIKSLFSAVSKPKRKAEQELFDTEKEVEELTLKIAAIDMSCKAKKIQPSILAQVKDCAPPEKLSLKAVKYVHGVLSAWDGEY